MNFICLVAMSRDAFTAEGNLSHAICMDASMERRHTPMEMSAFRGLASGRTKRNAASSTSGATARRGRPASETIHKPQRILTDYKK
jgi:hypothetical protein